ncbi:ribosome silencing factor [Aureibacter tunicatorum]|uniref:Ribosomal silencing factor RsfS n=1 Tax=Aureibacter tunicatorum TaxID=866807 RepID=A0AAE3XML4_9BACT|nr:ribosome silencing factor [Aureibacter tunicatorum]MDR6237769.1 ribosome-associated protein [Aureibacter tunicatorum]BDD02804.1 ribosomal silencing factor RsfS [Aureibacter tunicatorum]
MKEKKQVIDSKKLSEIIAQGMLEKKASNVVIMDLREISGAIADFFVISSGNSETQVEAIADSVEEFSYKAIEENPWHKEGFTNKEWILLDYVDVVAHVFKKDRREFFNIEGMWGDAKITRLNPENSSDDNTFE